MNTGDLVNGVQGPSFSRPIVELQSQTLTETQKTMFGENMASVQQKNNKEKQQ